MIITKQKPFSEVLECIKHARKIFLTGCNVCAAVCKTGGEKQVEHMTEALLGEGKTITGSAVLDPACNLLEVRRLYRKKSVEINDADIILNMSCGGGAQGLVDIISAKEVCQANDTLFQGEITEVTLQSSKFDQKCSLCGDCMLDETGGICPVTRCSKGLVNGPCGGIKKGKCEVDDELDCIWLSIYERLKKFDRLSKMKKIKLPKDHSKNKSPRSLVVK